jgi:hypothetical protein
VRHKLIEVSALSLEEIQAEQAKFGQEDTMPAPPTEEDPEYEPENQPRRERTKEEQDEASRRMKMSMQVLSGIVDPLRRTLSAAQDLYFDGTAGGPLNPVRMRSPKCFGLS